MPNNLSIHSINVAIAPKINLAFFQNAVPWLREIVIINDGKKALQNIELIVLSEPAFMESKKWRIDVIEAGQHYHLTRLDLPLDGKLLGHLGEAKKAVISFILKAGEQEISRLDQELELLPPDRWGGIGHMPEMVAAFVQPDEPSIAPLLKKTAKILRHNKRNSELNGYAGGSQRALELVSAIWIAVGSIEINYALPPVGFEQIGQRISSPGQITDSGRATCLDLTLLFCAAMERCGLNPLIIFLQGHVLAGVWLMPEAFTTVVVDDITALRRRMRLKELVIFETTLVTQHPSQGLKRAVEMGSQLITENKVHKFELAVDVHRAHLDRIRPLTTSVSSLTPLAPPQVESTSACEEAPKQHHGKMNLGRNLNSAEPLDRLKRWQRKLLDLSLRNRLLNFQLTRRTIKIDAPDPFKIEEMLAAGHTFKLLSRSGLMDGSDLSDQTIYERRSDQERCRSHALAALESKELTAGLPKEALEGRLVELYRSARLSLQQGGANTLFLAMGLLQWTKAGKTNRTFRAPLILRPVNLMRKSARSGFRLKLLDDEPRFNPALIEFLSNEFQLELQVTQGELPRGERGLNIPAIWESVAQTVKNIQGWEVVEDVILSTFSFAKYLMWRDLVERSAQLKQNSVVRHLLDTPREAYPAAIEFPEPRFLDKLYAPEQISCPLSVDSSQLCAVVAASKGQDFILIGPPGTGKSQTIVNIIAHCLAERKTVLFISEKQAALNVVYRRLREIKLGDFCLEIHSNKTSPFDVIQQLGRAWDSKGALDGNEWKREARRLKMLRDQLNQFVSRLHNKRRNGLTVYHAMEKAFKGRGLPKIGLSWPSADVHSEEERIELEEFAEKLDLNAQRVHGLAAGQLAVISMGEWSAGWQQSLINAAVELRSAAESLEKEADIFFEAANIPKFPLDKRRREGLALLCKTLPYAAGHDWRFALQPDAPLIKGQLSEGLKRLIRYRKIRQEISPPWSVDLIRKIKEGLAQIERHREISGQLSASYKSAILELDVETAKQNWEKAAHSIWPFNRLGQRRVQELFSSVAEDEADLNLPADIDRMIELRRLERQIASLSDLTLLTSGLWDGFKTRADSILAAIKFQATSALALAGENPSLDGFDAVSGGYCGTKMESDLRRLKTILSLKEEISKFDYLNEITFGLWNGLDTNTEELVGALNFQKYLYSAINNMATSQETLDGIRISLACLMGTANDMLAPTGSVCSTGDSYCKALERFNSDYNTFFETAGMSDSEIEARLDDTSESIKKLCKDILRLGPELRIWCAWCRVRRDAKAHGLAPLVTAIEDRSVELGQVGESFKTDYARWWLNATVDQDDVLREFVSAEHEQRIAEFNGLDDRFSRLTCDYIRADLCANLPAQKSSGRNAEWGILRHELEQKRGHMPLRELMRKVPRTITKLSPCFLMSPSSVAQYLPAEATAFDIVIFDEASQIPAWDAIGAVARGKQVVVVGDPQQLPPANFFDHAESEIDAEDVANGPESILDECLGANMPTIRLARHYRSRYESLITFSNRRYYAGDLVTFPSPESEETSVRLHFVEDGVYERGEARINQPEAKALVAHVVVRLKEKSFKQSGMSIGVVTFNSQQQRLIENLFDIERRNAPELEIFFAEGKIEPIFVKNLESVQGDERDIIYLSIIFGPDKSGARPMNLGPLSRDGGERRLNVAITRARHELLVFSSLKPEQIDLSRTSSIGVRDLKHFLEFAGRGPQAFAESVRGDKGEYERTFEKIVAEALESRGWQVHSQIGVSSFRIDLGVVDPDAPGRYLAGLAFDGGAYYRAATARDRDKLCGQVLSGLGWNILRIWSVDWWIDLDGALDNLHAKLEKLLAETRSIRPELIEKISEIKEESSLLEEISSSRSDQQFEFDMEVENKSLEINPIPSRTIPEPPKDFAGETCPSSVDATNRFEPTSLREMFIRYKRYTGPSFNDPRNETKKNIAKGLRRIIAVEGPMICKRAYDIYLRGCGIKRIGKELKRIMDETLRSALTGGDLTVEDEFKTGKLVGSVVRIVGTPPIVLRKRGTRSLDEVPPSEVLVAAYLSLKVGDIQKGSDEHLHNILDLYDLKRLTTGIRSNLTQIIEMEFDYVPAWFQENHIDFPLIR